MAKKDDTEPETESLAANDAWTGMLIVSFLALSTGAGFLAWDWYRHSDKPPTPPDFTSKPPGKGAPKEEPKKKDDEPEKKKDEPKADEKKKDMDARAHQPINVCQIIDRPAMRRDTSSA